MTCMLPVEEEPDLELILQSEKFKQDLAVMERVVLANIVQPKLAAYRQLPWPDRIFHCESGVTALDFSACNANQLVVGMYDGSIAIYNIQTAEQTPIIDSSDCADMHTCPVWQLSWVDHETGLTGEDKGEMLISVSGDGRISKWIQYKGLECVDLMKLKSPNMIMNNQRWNPKILSLAPGLCFGFHPNIGLFICGGRTSRNLCCFTSGQKVVFDIMWSPHFATVFGAVSEGKVEIWDLRVSGLDPTIVSMTSPGVNPTALLCTPETDCVLVGDSEGQVTVYKLKNLPAGGSTQVEMLEDVIRSTLSSQHTLGKTDGGEGQAVCLYLFIIIIYILWQTERLHFT